MSETGATGPNGPTILQGMMAKAVLALTFSIAAGAATGSIPVMIAAFAITTFITQLGTAAIISIASTPWGEKPAILFVAILRSVATAASGVAVFGVLLGGSVALNLVIADFRMRELDVWIGILPFAGIMAYSVMLAPSVIEGIRRHPIRIVTRGVLAAGLAAVVLYMLHATVHVLKLV
jgi:hypothetical protein